MSADGDTVRDALNARGLLGDDRRQGALVALARLEAAEADSLAFRKSEQITMLVAQRDALAEALRRIVALKDDPYRDVTARGLADVAENALAETGLE